MPSDEAGAHTRPAPFEAQHARDLFEGRYSDGRTAAGRMVGVRVAPDGIELIELSDGSARLWPFTGLSSAQPVSPRSTDILLRSQVEPGATLFVASRDFVVSISRRAQHMTAGSERWRYLKPALAVVLAIAIFAGLVWLFDWSPTRAIAGLVPGRAWSEAGGHLAGSFERDYPGCTDQAGRAVLDKLLARLIAAAPDQRPVTLHVANWTLVNAFALPGRHLMLTAGIIREAKSPEELAGILAHEIGHVIEQHPEAGLVRQLGLALGLKIVFAGSSESLQNLGGLLLLLRYTRVAEREADQRAYEILQKARISPKPLASFFERMAAKEDKAGGGKLGRQYEVLSTHPALDERARLARQRPDYPTEPILTEAEWQTLRGVCKLPARSDMPKATQNKPDKK